MLTAAGALAREEDRRNPGLIYLPEVHFDTELFLEQVKKGMEEQNNLVVCVSEGIQDADGKLICEYDSETGVDPSAIRCWPAAENIWKSW